MFIKFCWSTMLKKLFIFFLLVIPVLAVANDGSVLKVSGPPNYLPMSFVDKTSGHPTGVSYDIVKLLGERLSVPIKIFPNLPWRRALVYLNSGELDILVAIYKTPEREEKYLFSVPYHQNAAHIFVRKDRFFNFKGLNDLLGKTGEVPMGDSFGSVFDTFVKEHNLRIEYAPTKTQRFKKLLLGRSDYVIQDKLDGLIYIRQNFLSDKIIILPKAISFTKVHFAISKKSFFANKIPEINCFLEELKRNGTITSLINKYIND